MNDFHVCSVSGIYGDSTYFVRLDVLFSPLINDSYLKPAFDWTFTKAFINFQIVC